MDGKEPSRTLEGRTLLSPSRCLPGQKKVQEQKQIENLGKRQRFKRYLARSKLLDDLECLAFSYVKSEATKSGPANAARYFADALAAKSGKDGKTYVDSTIQNLKDDLIGFHRKVVDFENNFQSVLEDRMTSVISEINEIDSLRDLANFKQEHPPLHLHLPMKSS